MKFCSKCGKEIADEAVICPGCGCAVQQNKSVNIAENCEKAAKGSVTTNTIGGILLGIGIVIGWFFNVWIGAALCLIAELVVLSPNSKINKLIKNNSADKKESKAMAKKLSKELKKKYFAFKFSFVLAYISLAFLVFFALISSIM